MTNLQIILGAMELAGVKEEVDTYQGWKRRGYQVDRGQKAKFQTKIWKPCKRGKTEEGENETPKLILVNASFFGKSQVVEAK